MITKSTLSILGLYRYDPTIFDDMSLPAVITEKGNEHLVYEQILLSMLNWRSSILIPP